MTFDFEKLKKYLVPKEEILSIEISESIIRIFSFKQGSYLPKIADSINLPPGTLEKGALIKPEILIQALVALKQRVFKNQRPPKYAILTLPSSLFYTTIIPLPELTGKDLNESVQINIQMNSPIQIENAYLDWHKISSPNTGDQNTYILAAVVDQAKIDSYIKALEAVGLKMAAIEMHSLSYSRAVYNLSGVKEPYLLIDISKDGLETVIGTKDNIVFANFSSWQEISRGTPMANITIDTIKEYLANSIPRFLSFYNARYSGQINKFYLGSGTPSAKNQLSGFVANEFHMEPISLRLPANWNNLNDDWLGVIGAGIRSLIAREDDTMVSLAPVGTEEGYVQNRTLSYISFWSKIATLVMAVILGIQVGLSYAFFMPMANALKTKSNYNFDSLPITTRQQELAAKARDFNALTSQITSVMDKNKNWSVVFTELFTIASANQTEITHMFISTDSKQITMQAEAPSRQIATNFKDALDKSSNFTNTNMPLGAFSEQPKIVNFTLNLNLRW